jgi:hypothetical protein
MAAIFRSFCWAEKQSKDRGHGRSHESRIHKLLFVRL